MHHACVIAVLPFAFARLDEVSACRPGGLRYPPIPVSLFGQLAKTYNAKVRGAQITVRCDCGGIGYVPYGERWECPTCHRRWNTGQIPAEEYWGIMRDMRRMRISVILTALALVVPVVVLAA